MQKFRAATFALSTAIFILPALAAAQETNSITTLIVKRAVEFDDSRIALIKTSLQISDDQEIQWTTLETALKDVSRQRAKRKAALMVENDKRKTPLTPAELLHRQADALVLRAQHLQQIAEASDPLYLILSDDQRQRANELVRAFAQRLFVDDDPRYRRARTF